MNEEPSYDMGENDIPGKRGGLRKTLMWVVPLVIVIAVVIIFVLSGDDEAESAYYELVARANTSFNRENYEEAKELYSKALEERPDDEISMRRIDFIDSIMAASEPPAADTSAAETVEVVTPPEGEEAAAAEEQASGKPKDPSVETKEAEAEPVEKETAGEKEVAPRYKFHIVVGAFENRSNAINYSRKLKETGVDSKTIPIMDGKMTAVTYGSFNDREKAVMGLRRVQREFEKNAWLLEH